VSSDEILIEGARGDGGRSSTPQLVSPGAICVGKPL